MFSHTPRLIPEKAVFRPVLALCLSSPGSNGTNVTMTYKEQLLHPNWQRKRLEVLQRADFKCERCEDGDTTLHVHHKHYVKGRLAWEYDNSELVALCVPCHEEEGQSMADRAALIARLHSDGPLGVEDFMAYGAGAMAHWMADEDLSARLDQHRDAKPLQFWAGRCARDIAFYVTKRGMETLADLLERDEGFLAEVLDLLERRGVGLLRTAREGSDG